MGRRGSISWMYEVLISLILLAFFALVIYAYIGANVNGQAYFSKFHAADISTSAEVVNAGYGDVLLRYDNFKPSIDLGFWLTNGEVAVSAPVTNRVKPPTAIKKYYIFATESEFPDYIENPRFLSLQKTEDLFTISEVDESIASCPSVEPLPKEDVTLNIDGVTEEEKTNILTVFEETTKITTVDSGKIKITLVKKSGDEASIKTSASSEHGSRFSCFFKKHLEQLSSTQLEGDLPETTGTNFDVKITLTLSTTDTVTNTQIGQALGAALARYFE